MKNINKNKIIMNTKITSLLIAAFFTFAGISSHAAPGKVYNWKLAESWSDDTQKLGTANRLMAKYAKDLSNGKLNITIANVAQQSSSSDVFDLVKNNQYQMGHTASSLWKKKDINMIFFSSLPFGMITPEIQAWFYEGGGIELMKKVYVKHGLLSFPGGSFDTQMGGWFNKPIQSISDLNGLRMRINGIAGDIIEDLGVKKVTIDNSLVLDAFASGNIDAVEWGGPYSDIDMRFAEIATHYYTAWHKPSSELQFLINQEAYNRLPKDLQYTLKIAMRLAAYDTYTQVKHDNALKLTELREKFPRIKIQAFPTDVMIALKNNTNKQMQTLASRGGLTTEIFNSLTSYQKQIRLWTRIGDQAYLNN